MGKFDRKKHWENIYNTKQQNEVSWFQALPETSLNFIKKFNVPLTAKIIDIGGGDSFFADALLDLGYKDITVLDISEVALNKAKLRLGSRAALVKWIAGDAANFVPSEKYDFWHDRAAFHFLTEEQEINNYLNIVQQFVNANGILLIGTFSEKGPDKCSGIKIKQYSEISMTDLLKRYFDKIECISIEHQTPFDTSQSFIFCSFRKF